MIFGAPGVDGHIRESSSITTTTTTTTTTTGVYPKRAHFLCVCTFSDGPQRAAQDRSCSASQAATTALMVATLAAVDRCGPGHVVAPLLTKTEEGQGRGGGERYEVHGQVPDDSSSPAGALQSVRRRARRRAACQPGRAAGTAGADPAAHHGAACRNCSHGADPRCSCAAGGGQLGGCAEDR